MKYTNPNYESQSLLSQTPEKIESHKLRLFKQIYNISKKYTGSDFTFTDKEKEIINSAAKDILEIEQKENETPKLNDIVDKLLNIRDEHITKSVETCKKLIEERKNLQNQDEKNLHTWRINFQRKKLVQIGCSREDMLKQGVIRSYKEVIKEKFDNIRKTFSNKTQKVSKVFSTNKGSSKPRER